MQITIGQAKFLIKLLDDYKDNVYIHMRKNGYNINDTLDFINGYSVVVSMCYNCIVDTIDIINYDDIDTLRYIIFNSCDDAIKELQKITKNALGSCILKLWEIYGIKYAICLARFYIVDVLSGKDTEVEDELLYMNIPDKDNPVSYNWEEHGWSEMHYGM